MASFAAIFAIGKPVAFDASADERDTRGFISMTTSRPVGRVAPRTGCCSRRCPRRPRAAPRCRGRACAGTRRSVSVMAGATVTESPVCTPIGSTFSMEQTTTTLSCRSRISSSSYSFQPSTLSSMSTSCTGRRGQAGAGEALQVLGGVRHAGAEPAHGERRPDDHRQAQLGDGRADLVHGVADPGAGHQAAGSTPSRTPALATISLNSCRSSPRRMASMLAPISSTPYFSSTPGLVQRDRGVQRGLPAQRGQQRVGPLAGDDLLDELRA